MRGRYDVENILLKLNKKKPSMIAGNNSIDKFYEKKRLKKSHYLMLKSMETVLESLYPDLYDIQYEVMAKFTTHTNAYGHNSTLNIEEVETILVKNVSIVIRFPEFDITNSKGETHKIKELFTCTKVDLLNENHTYRTNPNFHSLYGQRTKYQPAEIETGYQHSHLSSSNLRSAKDFIGTLEYNRFCMGDGDVPILAALLNGGYDEANFTIMAMNINDYVKWESIEGGPHIKMEGVLSKTLSVPEINPNSRRAFFQYMQQMIKAGSRTLNLNWKHTALGYKLVDDELFENCLLEFKTNATNNTGYWLNKDNTGAYFLDRARSTVGAGIKHSYVSFRNTKVMFEIEPDVTPVKLNLKFYLNPKIKSYVKARLEFYANSSQIRKAGISKLSTSDNL